MMEPQAARWDGSLASLFAALDEACRRGAPPRRLDRAEPPGRTVSFAGAAGGGGGPVQPELFTAPETQAVWAVCGEEPAGGPVFPGPEFSRQPFPDLRDSGCPSGGFSAALLYELSADAFDAVIHAWMSELPIAAEIIRFAWNVIAAAREEVFQGGPPGTEPPDHPGLWPEPAAGADVPAGSAALYGPVWTALPEARRGAEKAAASRGDPDVRRVLEAAYKVRRETDRLRGLLRFNPCPRNGVSGGIPGAAAPSGGADSGGGAGKSLAGSSGDPVYIARCSPDHYILPGLADHFTRRFGECPWAVIDEKRDLVLAREPGGEARIFPLSPGWFPVPGGPGHQTDSGDPSDGFEDLWRNYHHSINNPDRNNPALQRQFLPRRYRKYLPELQ